MASPLTPRTVHPASVTPPRSHPAGDPAGPLAGHDPHHPHDPVPTDPRAGLRPLPPESLIERIRRWIDTRSLAARNGLGPAAAGPDLHGGPAPEPGPASPGGRYRRLASSAAVVVVVLGVGWWLLRPPPAPLETVLPVAGAGGATTPAAEEAGATPAGATAGSAPGDPATAAAAGTTTSAPELVVQAAGAVASPGVYRLTAGARVDDLIRAAGGVTPDADADRVNLAAPLTDGERVWVPRRGETEVPAVVAGGGSAAVPAGGGAAAGGGSGGAPSGQPVIVDLNTATAEELDSLPGVGPATATAILSYRDSNGPFSTVDELLEVRGIGEAKLEQLRPLVRV